MISAAELASIRTTQNTALPHSAYVLDRVLSSDGSGGQDEEWVARPAAVLCRLGLPSTEDLAIAADRLSGFQAFTITFPSGTQIEVGDRLQVTTAEEGIRTFQVRTKTDGHTYETATRVVVEQIA